MRINVFWKGLRMKKYIRNFSLSVMCLCALGYVNSANADCYGKSAPDCKATAGCRWGHNDGPGECNAARPCSCLTKN